MAKLENNDLSPGTSEDLLTSLWDMVLLIRRHWIVFLLIVAVFIVGFLGYSLRIYVPYYECRATFSLTPLVESDATNGLSVYKYNNSSAYSTQMSATFPYIAESSNLLDMIRYDLGYVDGRITAHPVTGSNVFEVSVTSRSPENAFNMLESFSRNFPKISDYILGDTRLKMVYSSGKPIAPSNADSHLWYSLYGLGFGAVVALFVFFIMALRRETIHGRTEMESKLNGKCICEIPHVDKKRTSTNQQELIGVSGKNPAFSESMRLFKRRLNALLRDGERVLAITSAVIGEGKTTLAYNISRVYASGDKRVLLIDLDLQRRDLQNRLQKDEGDRKGITDICVGNGSVEQVLSLCRKQQDNFDVLYAGTATLRYTNARLGEVIAFLRDRYDMIILDTPCCGAASDVSHIVDLSDAVMMMVRFDSTSVSDIKRGLQYIMCSSSRFLGFVLNECGEHSSYYGRYRYKGYGNYRYRYGYGYRRYVYGHNHYYGDKPDAKV